MTDLKALSDAATGGEWATSYETSWGCVEISAGENLVEVVTVDECDPAVNRSNAEFIIALVNKYRAGELVERTTPPA